MLVDSTGVLTGIFTDSDLARLLESKQDDALDASIGKLMTRAPTTVAEGTLMPCAIELLSERKISELPVVNGQGEPIGLIDITDVLAGESSSKTTARSLKPSNSSNDAFPKTLPLPNRSPS
jgi:arabinose-5-phosphate isomerase